MVERRFEIDRRPLWRVLISRLKRQLWLGLLLGFFAWAVQHTPPEGLPVEGWQTLCIFLLCATIWATSLLPLAITSLLAIALLPMLGVLDAKITYAFFGSKVVFFILGAFMLAAALIATGLSTRIATAVVRKMGRTPRRLIMAVFLLCAGGSTVMSVHAVAVMMLPIVQDIARALRLDQARSQFGQALFFALAWGCVVGGTLTILGGGRAPLGIGILEEVTRDQVSIGFLEYSLYTLPLVLILLLAAGALLLRRFEPEIADTEQALSVLETKLHAMGKPQPREQVVAVVLVATVGLWAFAGDTLGLANIAICSMAALFCLGAVGWKDVEQNVNWGIVVMYGGAICLGAAMERTGAAEWITAQTIAATNISPTGMLVLLALASALLTEFMSNSAVVAMLMPPALSLAATYGIDPRAITMLIILPSNFAFMFPISTPVMGIAWSGGYFTPRLVARQGILLHGVAFVGMLVLIFAWWPALGLLNQG
jgi:sodium-dependent dicarboxylate transporter 2/3/5